MMNKKSEKNMKLIINHCLIMLCAILLAACDYGKTAQQLEVVRSENDSLLQVTITQQNELADLVSTLNAAADKLDDINGKIAINTNDQNLQNQRARILQQLDNLQQQIAEKQKLFDDMQRKYKGVLGENKELKKSIDRMQKEIEGYQMRIVSYENKVVEQAQKITSLSNTLMEKEAEIEEKTSIMTNQSALIDQQDVALNRRYYIVAKKSTLKEMGLVEGGVFNKTRLTTKGFDVSKFAEIDIRNLNDIELGSKGAKLLTPAPETSYEMVKGIDKTLTLHIIDRESFWSLSKYLVIMID